MIDYGKRSIHKKAPIPPAMAAKSKPAGNLESESTNSNELNASPYIARARRSSGNSKK